MDQFVRSEDFSSSIFLNSPKYLMLTPEIQTSETLGGRKRRRKLTCPIGIKGYETELLNVPDQSEKKPQQSPQQSYHEDLTDQSKSVNVSYIYPDQKFSHSIQIRNHSVRMSAKSRALFSPISASKPLQNELSPPPASLSQTQYPSLNNKINNSFHFKNQEDNEDEEEQHHKHAYPKTHNLSYSFKNSMNSFLQRSENKEEMLRKKEKGPTKKISELLLEEDSISQSKNSSRKSETPRLKAAGGYNQARFTQRVPRPIDLDYQGDVVHVFGDLPASSTAKIREHIDIENANQTKRAMLVIIKDASRFLSALKAHKYFYEPLELISEGRRKRGQSPLALVKRLDSHVINRISSNFEAKRASEQSYQLNWIKTKLIHIHIGNIQRRNSKRKISNTVFQNIEELKSYVEQLQMQPENIQQPQFIQTLQFPQFSPTNKSGFIRRSLENYSTPKATKSAVSLQEWHFYNSSLQHINQFCELNVENEGAVGMIIACPSLLQEINISDTFGEKEEDSHSRISKEASDASSGLNRLQYPGIGGSTSVGSNKQQKERVSPKNKIFSPHEIGESDSKAKESSFRQDEFNQCKDEDNTFQHTPRSNMLHSSNISRSPQSVQYYRSKETTLFQFSLNEAAVNSDQCACNSPIRSNSKNLSSSRQSSIPKKNQTYLFTHLSQRANRLRDIKIHETKEACNSVNNNNQQLINEEIIKQNREKVLYQFKPKWVKIKKGMSAFRGASPEGQGISTDNENSWIHKIQQQVSEFETTKREKSLNRDSVVSKSRMNASKTSKKVYDTRRVDATHQKFLGWLGIASFRQISEIVFKDSFFDLSLSELEGIFSEFLYLADECTQFMQSAAPLAVTSSASFSQNIEHLFQYFIHIDLHLLKRSFRVFSRFKELNILRSVIKFIIPQQSHLIDQAFSQRQIIDIPFFWRDFLKFKVNFVLQKWSKNEKLEFTHLTINPDNLNFVPLKNILDLFPEGIRFPDPRQIKSFKEYLLNPVFLREGCVPFPRILDCLQKEIYFSLNDIIKYLTSSSLP